MLTIALSGLIGDNVRLLIAALQTLDFYCKYACFMYAYMIYERYMVFFSYFSIANYN